MKTDIKCEKFESADAAIASLGGMFAKSFEEVKARPSLPGAQVQFAGNGGALAMLSPDDEMFERPDPLEKPAYTGKVDPSIWVSRGDPLSMWHVNGVVEVVLRDGNGYEHFGKLSAPLNAEGGFGPTVEPQDEKFRWSVFNDFVLEERKSDALLVSASGVAPSRSNDRNYTHRATCLWTSRGYTGAPHTRAFLIVSWASMKNGAQYPTEALLMDGDKVWSFKMQREQSGGDRPTWKGRAA